MNFISSLGHDGRLLFALILRSKTSMFHWKLQYAEYLMIEVVFDLYTLNFH